MITQQTPYHAFVTIKPGLSILIETIYFHEVFELLWRHAALVLVTEVCMRACPPTCPRGGPRIFQSRNIGSSHAWCIAI